MRILNEKDEEITLEQVDPLLGHLEKDKIFVKHHERQEAVPEKFHYRVKTFYFTNGVPRMDFEGEGDPHIIVVDDQKGLFDYKNIPEDEIEREMLGADVERIIDAEAIEGRDAYDEYENIQRYILFTKEELAQQQAVKEEEQKKKEFLETGPDRLISTESEVSDLTVLIAELTAM